MEYEAAAVCLGDEWHVDIPGIGAFTTIWLRHLEIEARMMIADHHGIELHEASVKIAYGRSGPREWEDPDGEKWMMIAIPVPGSGSKKIHYAPTIRARPTPRD